MIIPEIVDYELRRELLRANKAAGIARLDLLIDDLEYLPITTAVMRRAAELWAQARQQGQPTASDRNLDADMILIAQTQLLNEPDAIIATMNIRHLAHSTANRALIPLESAHRFRSVARSDSGGSRASSLLRSAQYRRI